MILYHGTSIEAAKNIVKEGKINSSFFNILEYIDYVFNEYEVDTIGLPSLYKVNDTNKRVYWLGNGIYAFGSSDYRLAKTWRTRYGSPKLLEEECSVIQFEIDKEIAINCFDFTSYTNRKEVEIFFEEYMIMVDENYNDKMRERLLIFLSIIKEAFIKMEYERQEHLLGLAVEIFILNIKEDFPFICATFSKDTDVKYYETYYSVREAKLVKKIKEIS